MAGPNFWNNQESAQSYVTELRRLKTVVKPLGVLLRGIDDIQVLEEFAAEDDSGSSIDEIRQLVATLSTDLEAAELQAAMSRPEDACGAYLAVQAGEGGTDAADFAEMLMRMYLRWAENRGFPTEIIYRSDGEEAGIRNATIHIKGDYAFGFLRGEMGNHRLVRMSPFNAAGSRQTSFAAVDVSPDLGDEISIDIDWDKDVREDKMRAQGAGGQHVNKTESAIRLTHIESGVVVFCQNERSQHQNRALARKMLTAKLYQIEQDRRDAEQAARRGLKSKIGFGGGTIRHYVLQPQQFVKDERTELKTNNPYEVLDGALDPFIESYLRWSIGQG